jgi:ABC-2 type transport system permease protein
MSPAIAIAKREIRTYFFSPIPYIVATAFIILTGAFCFLTVLLEGQAEMRGYFGSLVPWMLPILMPAISMRLLAEEKGSGSLELLITMPVRDWEVVVGKFLAALAFLAVMIGLTFAFAISISFIGPLDKGAATAAYVGMFLQAGAYVAIGLMASSFTKNQIVAFIVGFFICFVLFLFGKVSPFAPKAWQATLQNLGADIHFEQMLRGVIDTRDLVYYLSIMAVSLVVATVSLDSRKWK